MEITVELIPEKSISFSNQEEEDFVNLQKNATGVLEYFYSEYDVLLAVGDLVQIKHSIVTDENISVTIKERLFSKGSILNGEQDSIHFRVKRV